MHAEPASMPRAVRAALGARCAQARALTARNLPDLAPEQATEWLVEMLDDPHGAVRRAVYEALAEHAPAIAATHLDRALADPHPMVRLAGLRVAGASEDDALWPKALPLMADRAEAVRAEALVVAARTGDPQTLNALVAGLHDPASSVQAAAREALSCWRKTPPAFARDATRLDRMIRDRGEAIARVHAWARRTGHELLGQPVEISGYRDGLGRTFRVTDRAIRIEISDKPLSQGHPHGEQIMKGLVLHELGHHLCDIGVRGERSIHGAARAEGLDNIFDILCDERLERVLRARRPAWGVCFDRLASYAFAQRTHRVPLTSYAEALGRSPFEARDRVVSGSLPGEVVDHATVVLSEWQLLTLPGVAPLGAAFLACLRCGFDPRAHPDPRIAQAIDAVPADLKDLDHAGVLAAARRIGAIIGREREEQQRRQAMRRRLRRHAALLQAVEALFDRLLGGETPPASSTIDDLPERLIKGRSRPSKARRRSRVNQDSATAFEPLRAESDKAFDPAAHRELVAGVRRHVRPLRAYLERLGQRSIEEYATRRGRRLDLGVAGRAAITGSPSMLVADRQVNRPDAYFGLVIDRSGSMRGQKMELARCFGALLIESARGIRGIRGDVSAFDAEKFYHLGDLQRNAIATLEAGGGNNDAGGLARAAGLARRSGKRNRLLVMISDGSPTECSVAALRHLVNELTREGVACAQVAVDQVEHRCFDHAVNVADRPMPEAIAEFGRTLMNLTSDWR